MELRHSDFRHVQRGPVRQATNGTAVQGGLGYS